MKVEKHSLIKLNNEEEYLVVSIAYKENIRYFYLVNILNNEDMKFCMEKVEDSMIKLIEVTGSDNIEELLPLFTEDIQEID